MYTTMHTYIMPKYSIEENRGVEGIMSVKRDTKKSGNAMQNNPKPRKLIQNMESKGG